MSAKPFLRGQHPPCVPRVWCLCSCKPEEVTGPKSHDPWLNVKDADGLPPIEPHFASGRSPTLANIPFPTVNHVAAPLRLSLSHVLGAPVLNPSTFAERAYGCRSSSLSLATGFVDLFRASACPLALTDFDSCYHVRPGRVGFRPDSARQWADGQHRRVVSLWPRYHLPQPPTVLQIQTPPRALVG